MASIFRAVCLLLVYLALFQCAAHARRLGTFIPTQKSATNDQFSAVSVTVATYSNPLHLAVRSPRTDKPLVDVIDDGIKNITQLSDDLRQDTEEIDTLNAPQRGGQIAVGFSVIIETATEVTAAIAPGTEGVSPLDDDDAQKVVEVLTTFVQVHQALLNTVIGKHGILTLIPFFEPIRLALVQLEIVVDALAFNLINLIPTQQSAASLQVASLDVTIKLAVTTYSTPLLETALAHAIH